MVEKITVKTETGESSVIIGEKISAVRKYAAGDETIIITDNTIAKLYGREIAGLRTIIIPEGEKSKTLKTVENIYSSLYNMGADRNSFIAGLGGGVVTDVTGFAASTYMRGISYGFAPTTLLSQVDAAIGGKNGVNFKNCKNIVGTISQPDFVLIDIDTLATLSENEFLSGLGEVVKHGIIGGGTLFSVLEESLDPEKIFNKTITDSSGKNVLPDLIRESVKIKARVVGLDEKESGLRRILNLGHTLAHTIEMEEKLPHGIAVIKGIMFSVMFSRLKGFLPESEAEKIISLLKKTGVDLDIKAERRKILELVNHDKKKYGDSIYFVFIRKTGDVMTEKIAVRELSEAIDDLRIGR